MADKTLYDKAVSNFVCAKAVIAYPDGDEDQLNFAGFHLQQAVELAMKYLLEQSGIEYPKTYSIEQLIGIAKDNEVDLFMSDYIEDHAEMFSQWEAKSRYVIGYTIEVRKIERALGEVDDYLAAIAQALNG